jgi:hypothetical protein
MGNACQLSYQEIYSICVLLLLLLLLICYQGLNDNSQPPDTVLHDKEKTCQMIEIALTVDSNVNIKQTEILSQRQSLHIAVSR